MLDVSFLIRRRDVAAEERPAGGGVECFDTPEAVDLNAARLTHLATLELPLTGRRVLEVGAGVGRLTGFFLGRGCSIIATEAREENLDELRRRLPEVEARQANVEESLAGLGRFEVVFCYGLLYHLENPVLALRNMAAVCDDLLLLETIVCDASEPILRLDDETTTVSQALSGIAHRPSRTYLALALARVGFEHVYGVTVPPAHPDYVFHRLDDLSWWREGRPLREVLVASRHPLVSSRLESLLEPAR